MNILYFAIVSKAYDFRKLGSQRLSKDRAHEVARHLVCNPSELEEFFNVFIDDNWRYNQYLSHPLGMIAEENQEILLPYLDQLIQWSERDDLHKSVRRNIVRTWQYMEIPEEHSGIIYDLCYNWVIDPQETVAVRAFAMTVLANFAEKHPELKEDVLLAIEQTLEAPTPGIRSRAKNIRHKLKKT